MYVAANDGSDGSSADIDMGHTWVVVVDSKGNKTTYGLWSDGYSERNGPGNDIRVNFRSDVGRVASAVRYADVPESRRAAVASVLKENVTYSEYTNNCVHFAIRVWQAATASKVELPPVYPPTPHWLIGRMNGSRK